MTEEDLLAKFRKKRFGVVYFAGFSAIYLGGFGLLWYATNWKVLVAVFLICYGVLLQAHPNIRGAWLMKRSGFKRLSFQEALARRKGKKVSVRLGKPGTRLRAKKRLSAGRKTRDWNRERRKLKIESERSGITTCELRGVIPHECTYDNFLGYAHNAKRWELSAEDLKVAILVCNNVHDKLERMKPEEMKRIVNDTIAARKEAA